MLSCFSKKNLTKTELCLKKKTENKLEKEFEFTPLIIFGHQESEFEAGDAVLHLLSGFGKQVSKYGLICTLSRDRALCGPLTSN